MFFPSSLSDFLLYLTYAHILVLLMELYVRRLRDPVSLGRDLQVRFVLLLAAVMHASVQLRAPELK